MNKNIALFGEYMLRLTPPSQQKLIQSDLLEMHWAGSEANIAASLSIFGNKSLYITALPDNELARAGLSQLYKYGVNTNIIPSPEGRVGIYYYESGQGARPGRIIYDREHSVFSYLKPGQINWQDIFDQCDWFHWSGITPALNLSLAAVCKEALQVAREKKLTISADFNYRSTLWKYGKNSNEVMPELLQFCDVVLADVDTAKLYFDIEPDAENLVETTFGLLKHALPAVKYMAMTMRGQESANANQYTGYLWNEGKIYESSSYNIQHIAERIGAGDAFMAGLIHSLRAGERFQETIEFATACAVLKHSLTGDFNIGTKNEVDTVIRQRGKGKIIR